MVESLARAEMTKLLFLLIDGFGDVNIFSNSNADDKNFADFFSQAKTLTISNYFIKSSDSYFGILDPIEPGVACGSDTAHLSIFGFDPIRYYSGRGAFETIGAGIKMNEGEIAFKCNFAYMDDFSGEVISRRADQDFSTEAKYLCDYLQQKLSNSDSWLKKEGVEVIIKHATEHRCGLKVGMSGRKLSSNICGTDPLIDGLKLRTCAPLPSGNEIDNFTSILVQRISDEIRSLLSNHPINVDRKLKNMPLANVVLFRGCAESPSLDSFDAINNVDWNGMMMAKTCIISGLGQSIGFHKSENYPDHEENIETVNIDLNFFLDEFLKSQESSFGFFHIKIVDDLSHDHEFFRKANFIEQLDLVLCEIVKKVSKNHDQDDLRIVLTGDHTTLCRIGEHSCEPVPILISCPLPKSDLSTRIVESHAKFLSECFYRNNIGRVSGGSLMKFLKHIVNKNS